ncbi:MAG: hypothetical protein JWR80_1601 [Bradyrhizobium sp.]|nr:hypothetical protein [Bradyrhizobium sp.]
MVEFPESFHAFVFQSEIDNIRSAFRASVTVLDHALRSAVEAYDRYIDSGEDDSEYDEDQILVRSTRQELDYATREASASLRVVREAFITSAFHYWERSARAWTKLYGRNDNFPALRDATAIKYGTSPHLEALNHLNNVLKHDSAHHARALAMLRIDLFRQPPFSIVSSKRETWDLSNTDAMV